VRIRSDDDEANTPEPLTGLQGQGGACRHPTKAHVVLPNVKRWRKDGSLIEIVSAFYAFTKTPEGWKMFAISGISVLADSE
jgi:hypothetical protein